MKVGGSGAIVDMVKVVGKYTGIDVDSVKSDRFSLASGDLTFTSPTSACLYLANKSNSAVLTGANDKDQASILSWMLYSEGDLRHSVYGWVLPCISAREGANPGTVARSKADLLTRLSVLDQSLKTRTFLVGERISLADIATAFTLLPAFTNVLDPELRSKHRHLTRWFNTIVNQEQVLKVLGRPVVLAAKEAEVVKAAPAPKKEKKKEAAAPPVKKPAKKVEELAEDIPVEPKKTDPLDPLPKGTFDLEDWKRFYSNNEEEASCKYFWEKFDPSCYSIWRGEYRYNKELTQVFMSCNLMGGMFQRLEKLKKNAFASACLFGENNNSSISGIWIFKGPQLAFELSEDWQIDYSSYSWEKLDPASPSTKEMVNNYWKWEGTDKEGRKFNQGKIFK